MLYRYAGNAIGVLIILCAIVILAAGTVWAVRLLLGGC